MTSTTIPQIPEDESTPAHRARFLDQLRTWYDVEYHDPSYGGCCLVAAVIPRMHAIIDTYAPSIGMQLAVTEWAFGFSDDDELAALAVAESMAIQGVYGVDWSLHWVSPAEGSVAEQSWQLFWNYDGRGARLQGDAVRTSAALAPNVTAYSFYDGSLQRLHVLVFSHLETAADCSSASSTLTVQHAATSASTAAVYDITRQHYNVTQGQPLKLTGSGDSIAVAAALCGLQGLSARLIVVESVTPNAQQQTVWKPWQLQQGQHHIQLDDPGMGMPRHAYEASVRQQKARKQQAKAARLPGRR